MKQVQGRPPKLVAVHWNAKPTSAVEWWWVYKAEPSYIVNDSEAVTGHDMRDKSLIFGRSPYLGDLLNFLFT